MLKLGTTDIADIKLGTTDIQKVMYLNDIIWQRGGIVPQPCFEVVNAISAASGQYVDVYNKADSKWYKKNNLNNYEEYGVYEKVSALSAATYYTGKLVCLQSDGHEYEWTGSQWNDVGSGLTYLEYIEHLSGSFFNSGYYPKLATVIEASFKPVNSGRGFLYHATNSDGYRFNHIIRNETTKSYMRFMEVNSNFESPYNVGTKYNVTINKTSLTYNGTSKSINAGVSYTFLNPLSIAGNSGVDYEDADYYIYYFNIKEGSTYYHKYIPAKDLYGTAGMLDTLDGTFHRSENSDFVAGPVSGSAAEWPITYDTKVAPPDYVSYATLEQLELMECPWVGMHAYVGGVLYVYTSNLEWVEAEIPYESQYLTFKAQESGTFTLTIHANVTTSNVTSVSYSVDNGSTWVTTQNSSSQVIITTPTIASGGTVLWKGTANNYGISNSYRSVFSSTCNFEAYGNTMSLLYGDNFSGQTTLTSSRTFNGLFESCATITSAENLILPATTLTANCYDHMLSKCTSLTTAPALPATTLAQECYSCMFDGSTSLVAAPELPATTLVTFCYYAMFNGCTSLNYIKCLATNISASYCTYVWVQNVSSSGTFVKNSSMTGWGTGTSGIPSNWTVENAT